MHGAIVNGDILEVPAALRSEFHAVRGAAQDAIRDRYMFCGFSGPKGKARFETDGVIARFDRAIGDANML
jgi:hypothetical protein